MAGFGVNRSARTRSVVLLPIFEDGDTYANARVPIGVCKVRVGYINRVCEIIDSSAVIEEHDPDHIQACQLTDLSSGQRSIYKRDEDCFFTFFGPKRF